MNLGKTLSFLAANATCKAQDWFESPYLFDLKCSAKGAHLHNGRTPGLDSAGFLQPGINRLAFQRQYPKDTFMNPTQRLAADKALERLNPECELPCGHTALTPKPTRPQALDLIWCGVFRAIDDA